MILYTPDLTITHDPAWDHSTFTQNRDRLLDNEMSGHFFAGVKQLAEWVELSGDEHFSIDDILLDTWASHKSFIRKDGAAIRRMITPATRAGTLQRESAVTPPVNRSLIPMHAWHARATAIPVVCATLGHVLMENRNGLVVDVSVSEATGMAEWEESLKLLQANTKSGATVGEDRGYDIGTHITLDLIPHVATKRKGSTVPDDIRQSEGYAICLKIRKRIEEVFGWMKTVGGMRKLKLIGREKVSIPQMVHSVVP